MPTSDRPAPADPVTSRGGPRGARLALRAVALGLFYAALAVALVIVGRAGKAFIYQGF